MELLKKDKQWFLSGEGGKVFTTLTTTEDRAIFIYSYLKTFVNPVFENNNTLFKTAFLLADAVFSSDVEYNSYPHLLDERCNPFIAFLANAKILYTEEQIYCIFLSFVHGIADPFNKAAWIYNESLFKGYEYIHMIDELGHMFVIPNKDMMVDPSAYNCEKKYFMIQLEIIWLFGNIQGG